MDNVKNDRYYIEKILEDLEFVKSNMEGKTKQDFSENLLLQDSMMFRLIQISEKVNNLSMQYQEEHNEVPWFAIRGMRNRIVHDYGNVNLIVVYETLTHDIPEIKKIIENALR